MEEENVLCKCKEVLFSPKIMAILPYVMIWMKPEDIVLSEISQTQKDKCCMVPPA
jgi:hypothetical protein